MDILQITGTAVSVLFRIGLINKQANIMTNKNTTAIATKFVKWDVPELDALKGSKVFQIREKVNAGRKLSREEKKLDSRKCKSQ